MNLRTRWISCAPGGRRPKGYRPVVESAEARLLLSTFTVTSTSDSGAGSLRQAILDSNNATTASTIDFAVGSGGFRTITPTTPLPTISNPVTIDGSTQPGFTGSPLIQINGSQIFSIDTNGNATTYQLPGINGLYITSGNTTVRGLDINRFTGNGIALVGASRNSIVGDYVGVDPTGLNILGNTGDGIFVSDSRFNTIGGVAGVDRNVLSGNNLSGVELTSASYGRGASGGNIIEGNSIGTDPTGTVNLGNLFNGITISTTNNIVGGYAPGAANVIAFNSGDGVNSGSPYYYYYAPTSISTAIVSNQIYANGGLGIRLGYGSNSPITSGILKSAYRSGNSTVVEGTLSANPDTSLAVQFFTSPSTNMSGSAQAQALVGSGVVATDDNGNASFTLALPTALPLNQYLTAIVTDQFNDSSAFFSPTRILPSARADLAVDESADQAAVTAGGNLTYTVGVGNMGPSNASGVVVTDTLPSGTTVSSVQAPGGVVAIGNGVVTVGYAALSSGASQTITIAVVSTITGTQTNLVSVAGAQADPNPANNTATLATPVIPSAVLPQVIAERLQVGLHSINGIVLAFNEPLDPFQATNPYNYTLKVQVRGNRFAALPLMKPTYNPNGQILTLTPVQPLQIGKVYQLTINGTGSTGLTDLAGNLLLGNTPYGLAGPYVSVISRGVVLAKAPNPTTHPAGTGNLKLLESVNARRLVQGSAADVASVAATQPSLSQAVGLGH